MFLLADAFAGLNSAFVSVHPAEGPAWRGPGEGNEDSVGFLFTLHPEKECESLARQLGGPLDAEQTAEVARSQRARVTREVVAALRALGFEPALQV